MTRFHLYDWLAIAAYVIVALAVGLWMARRVSSSTHEFYLAGRSLPWWVAGTSLVATSFAADTPLLITGWVRLDGISRNWLWWGMAVGGVLSFVAIAGWWRRANITTDAEFIEIRYSGRSARFLRGFYGGYHALVTNTLILVWVLTAMLKLVRVVLGVDDDSLDAIIVGAALALALAYSYTSGLWGVVVTDVLQFVLALAGGLILAIAAIDALGGMELARQAFAALPDNATSLVPLRSDNQSPMLGNSWNAAAYWVSGFGAFLIFVGVQGWLNKNSDGSGAAVQRYAACRNESHARGAALWFHLAHYWLRPWPWIIVALASIILIPDAELPLLADGSPDHEAAYVVMMASYLGPGLFGLMCASFLAAFMSTLDTHLNLASAYFVNDVYRRFLHQDASDRHYLRIGRLLELLVGLCAAVLATLADSISDLFTLSLSLLGGVGPAMLMRWFWWRTNVWTEISALLCSTVLTILIQTGLIELAYPLSYLLIVVSSLLISLIVTWLTVPTEHQHLQAFHDLIVPAGLWAPFRSTVQGKVTVPFLLGWAGGIALIYGLMLGTGAWLLGRDPGFYFLAAVVGGAILYWSWPRSLLPADPAS